MTAERGDSPTMPATYTEAQDAGGEPLPYKTGATPENDPRMTFVLLIRKLGELPSFFISGLVVVGQEKSVPLSNLASS